MSVHPRRRGAGGRDRARRSPARRRPGAWPPGRRTAVAPCRPGARAPASPPGAGGACRPSPAAAGAAAAGASSSRSAPSTVQPGLPGRHPGQLPGQLGPRHRGLRRLRPGAGAAAARQLTAAPMVRERTRPGNYRIKLECRDGETASTMLQVVKAVKPSRGPATGFGGGRRWHHRRAAAARRPGADRDRHRARGPGGAPPAYRPSLSPVMVSAPAPQSAPQRPATHGRPDAAPGRCRWRWCWCWPGSSPPARGWAARPGRSTGPPAGDRTGRPAARTARWRPAGRCACRFPRSRCPRPVAPVGQARDGSIAVPPLERARRDRLVRPGPHPGRAGPVGHRRARGHQARPVGLLRPAQAAPGRPDRGGPGGRIGRGVPGRLRGALPQGAAAGRAGLRRRGPRGPAPDHLRRRTGSAAGPATPTTSSPSPPCSPPATPERRLPLTLAAGSGAHAARTHLPDSCQLITLCSRMNRGCVGMSGEGAG